MKLKVCGLTSIDQVEELIQMKLDFLGFIFYSSSPRYALQTLDLHTISAFSHEGKTGVFVNETLEGILQIVRKANLHYIQLHGDETSAFCEALRTRLSESVKIIKVLRIGSCTDSIQQQIWDANPYVQYFLFDTDSSHYGGTGTSFDWTLLNELDIPKPYFLSGGISPEVVPSVSTLVLSPFALDINSKFETSPGIKDLDKIRLFYEKL